MDRVNIEEFLETPQALETARTRIAQCLNVGAILAALASLNTFVFSLFPLKLLDPLWQLGLATAVLAAATSLLIAFLLVICSYGFDPINKLLERRMRLIGRISAFLSLLLILLVPVQIFSGTKALGRSTETIIEQAKQLKTIIEGIKRADTEVQLRAYITSLPNAPSLPASFDAPFSVVKQRAITSLEGTINRALNDAEAQKSKSLQTFIQEAARNTIHSLLLAAAFAMIKGSTSGNYGLGRYLLPLLGFGKQMT